MAEYQKCPGRRVQKVRKGVLPSPKPTVWVMYNLPFLRHFCQGYIQVFRLCTAQKATRGAGSCSPYGAPAPWREVALPAGRSRML